MAKDVLIHIFIPFVSGNILLPFSLKGIHIIFRLIFMKTHEKFWVTILPDTPLQLSHLGRVASHLHRGLYDIDAMGTNIFYNA